MNIFVGNIPREITDKQIRDAFEEHGEVTSVTLIKDKYTNILKGFGFIEMPKESEAEQAIKSLDGTVFHGRTLTVNLAKRKNETNNNYNYNSSNNRNNFRQRRYQNTH